MSMSGSSSLATLLVLGLGLGGCTVAQLSQDVSDRQTRVGNKEQALAGDEARQDSLRAEIKQLEADLQQRQLSLDELQSGLDRLERQNALAAQQTEQQSARKRQLAHQLRSYQNELRTLRRKSDIPIEEKRKRLEHVQNEIGKALELLLRS